MKISCKQSLWWWFVFLICWIPFCLSPFLFQSPPNSNKKLQWAHFAERIKQRRKFPCSQYITFKNCNTIFLSGYVRGHCVCMMCTGKVTPIKQTNKDKHNTRWWTQIKPSVRAIILFQQGHVSYRNSAVKPVAPTLQLIMYGLNMSFRICKRFTRSKKEQQEELCSTCSHFRLHFPVIVESKIGHF